MLDAFTFRDQSIIDIANEKLISIKIDAETEYGMALFQKFKGTAYPLIIFLDNNKNEIDRFYGYLPSYEFMIKINNALNNTNSISDYLNQYNKGNHSAELLRLLADKHKDRGNYKQAINLFNELLLSSNQSIQDHDYAQYSIASLNLKDDNSQLIEEYLLHNSSSSNFENAVNDLLYYYQAKSDITNELSFYLKHLNTFNENAGFLNSYAWRMTELDTNLNDALQKINRGLSLINDQDKSYPFLLDTKAEILWKLNQNLKAINIIKQAIAIDSTNSYYKTQQEKFADSLITNL